MKELFSIYKEYLKVMLYLFITLALISLFFGGLVFISFLLTNNQMFLGVIGIIILVLLLPPLSYIIVEIGDKIQQGNGSNLGGKG